MIKLYVLYLVLGIYLLFESSIIWYWGADRIITGLALISSTLLCPIASGLSLYNSRLSLIIGLAGLLGVFPFGIYWLVFRYANDYFTEIDLENTLVCSATILYFIAIVYTIKLLITKTGLNIRALKKSVKIILAAVPIMLFLLLVGLEVFDK